jgi:hypothetical protein
MGVDLEGIERKRDSSWTEFSRDEDKGCTRPYLTCRQHSAHLANDGLVTTEVSAPLEDKADIVAEIVTLILSALQCDRKAYDAVVLDGADDKTPTKGTMGNDVLVNIIKAEESTLCRTWWGVWRRESPRRRPKLFGQQNRFGSFVVVARRWRELKAESLDLGRGVLS